MTINFCGSQEATAGLLLTNNNVIDNENKTLSESHTHLDLKKDFSWYTYPPTPQGYFFKACVEEKLVDSKGRWVYPKEVNLPPISQHCWRRIHHLLSTPFVIESKSLNRLPHKKQQFVMKAYEELEGYCRHQKIDNPITFDKKKNRLIYQITVSVMEILSTIFEKHPTLANYSEIHGGSLPYLLEKEYYIRALESLPLKKMPSHNLFDTLLDKPFDYDFRVFVNDGTYENLENIFESILRLLADKLLHMESNNEQLKFIIQETAFESSLHITTDDKHFKHFSFSNSEQLKFDFTLVDKLANSQLFHCHGLALNLESFLFSKDQTLPTPYGSLGNGLKAVIDKLAQIMTVENVEYPYHRGWHRLISSICKGSWSPNPTLEPSFRQHTLALPYEKLYEDLLYVSSQHTNPSILSKICTLLTARSFLDRQLSEIDDQKIWKDNFRNIHHVDDWLQQVILSIQSGNLSIQEVIFILQIGAILQSVFNHHTSVKCRYYESNEKGYVSIQVSLERYILLPIDLKRAVSCLKDLASNHKRKAITLLQAVLTAFLRNVEQPKGIRSDIAKTYSEDISEIADIFNKIDHKIIFYISIWLNLKGYGSRQEIGSLSAQFISVASTPFPLKQKLMLLEEYTSFLRRKMILKDKFCLWNLKQAISTNQSRQQVSISLVLDLIRGSNQHNFNMNQEIWNGLKKSLSEPDITSINWSWYQRANDLKYVRSVDILINIIENQNKFTQQVMSCWSDQITTHLDLAPFNKLVHLTELLVNKFSRRKHQSYFNQKALIDFFEKLHREGYHQKYVRLFIQVVDKKILFLHDEGVLKLFILSMKAIAQSDSIQLGNIIDIWLKIEKHKLTSKLKPQSIFQELIATLVERSYEENFDNFADDLLSHYATSGHPLFSEILENRIDQRNAHQEIFNLSDEVEKYSIHLTTLQIIRYKIDALMRNIEKGNTHNATLLCIDLLNEEPMEGIEANNFTICLRKVLNNLIKEQDQRMEEIAHQLFTHEILNIYIPQYSINEMMLIYITNTTPRSTTLHFYEQLIHDIDLLNERQKRTMTEYFVSYLASFHHEISSEQEQRMKLRSILEKKILSILTVLSSNEQLTEVLSLYDVLSKLDMETTIQSNGYDLIFSAFISIKDRSNDSEVVISSIEHFKAQLLSSSFYSTKQISEVIENSFAVLLNKGDLQYLVLFYRKCLHLLKKSDFLTNKDALIKILFSVQISIIQSGDKKYGMDLLNLIISCPQIQNDSVLTQIQKTKQYLDTISDFDHLIPMLSKAYFKGNTPLVEHIEITKKVASHLKAFSIPQMLSFTKLILKDNAELWCLFFDHIPKDFSKHNLNLFLSNFYKNMVNGRFKDPKICTTRLLQHILSITKETPLPFVATFLSKPDYVTNFLLTCSEEPIGQIRKDLISTIERYLQNHNPNDQQLRKLLNLRNGELGEWLKEQHRKDVSDLDHTLIVCSSDYLKPNLYVELCLLLKDLYQNSLIDQIAPERIIDVFLNMPSIQEFPKNTSESVLQIHKSLLEFVLPKFPNDTDLYLKICSKIIHMNYPLLNDLASQLTFKLLNGSKIPPKKLKPILIHLLKHTHNQTTEQCFSHPSLKENFTSNDYQTFVFEKLCSQVKNALATHQLKLQNQVFESSLELLKELSPSFSQIKEAISYLWDISITLYIKDKNFPHTLSSIHQTICYNTIEKYFGRSVEKYFVKQLWKYSKLEDKKVTPAVQLFFSITTDFQNKLLNHSTEDSQQQQAVTAFVHDNIEKIVSDHPEQREPYLQIIDKYIDYSLTIADETLFHFSLNQLQDTYKKAIVHDFFEIGCETLLKCIYFTELKDFAFSTTSTKDKQNIIAKMVHYISSHPNYVNLHHGFSLLTSLRKILYSQDPDRLFNLYVELLSVLPQFLHQDVNSFFYHSRETKKVEPNEQLLQQIINSSADFNTFKVQLQSINAKLNSVPLFECIRQNIMPGNTVQFSDWDKNAQNYSIKLIDKFYKILLEAYENHEVPPGKPFATYNTITYTCSMLIKAFKFHGFLRNQKKYFEFAYDLIPYIKRLLSDPRMKDRNSVYDVYEQLIFQETKNSTAKQQQSLVVHQWISILSTSENPKERSKGKKLSAKAKKLKIPNFETRSV